MDPFIKYQDILSEYISTGSVETLKNNWQHHRRHYHNLQHLSDILDYLEQYNYEFSPVIWNSLVLAAFFHDAIYDPKKRDNELQSIKFFEESWSPSSENKNNSNINLMVKDLIYCTRNSDIPKNKLYELFWFADHSIFFKDFDRLKEYERQIHLELIPIHTDFYKSNRIRFLKELSTKFDNNTNNKIKLLIEYINKL